jgi:hypothetical protein
LPRAAIKDFVAAGPGYETPSGGTLDGSTLERQYETDKTKWRVVVYLEWFKSKIPGTPYGDKKRWLLVSKPMPSHHVNEILASEDKTDLFSQGTYF